MLGFAVDAGNPEQMLPQKIQNNTNSENCDRCQCKPDEDGNAAQVIPSTEETDDTFIPEDQGMYMNDVHRINAGGDKVDQLSDKTIFGHVPERIFAEQEQTYGFSQD